MSRSRSIASATDSGNSGTAAQGDDNIQDDPDWQDGDFTLISSDGWRLKAWSYHLFSASAVLRDAQSCNGDNSNKEIHFVDMDFENRDILRLFLHLLTQPAVPFPTKDRLTHCLSLTNFLKKYDCGQGLQVLRLCVLAAFTAHGDRWEYVDAFVVGAALDDPLLCSTALQREEKARLRYGQPHFGIRDIPVVPLDFIPQHYLSALAKSVPGCGLYCECDSKEGPKHTAQEFPLILEVVKRDLQAARSKRRQAGTSNSASTGKKKRTRS